MHSFAIFRSTLGLLSLGLVLLLGALWAAGPLVHDDLFFHLATGQMVVETGNVPTTDPYSFTRAGERWVSHEWGFGLVTYAVWRLGELESLVALKAFLVVAILGMLFWVTLERSQLSLASAGASLAALLALGLWSIHDQLILRASLFSSLFILVLMMLLQQFDRSRKRWPFVAIVALFLVWGNFHGEVLFGLFLLVVTTTEAVFGRLDSSRPILPPTLLQVDSGRPYVALLTASLAATLINPNGVQVLLYPFRLAAFLSTSGDALEMGHFGGATPTAATGFYLLVALLLLASLPLQRLASVSLTEAVTIAAFLVLALRSHRFIFFFVLFTLPVVAKLLASRPLPARGLRTLRSVLVVAVLAAVAVTAASTSPRRPSATLAHHFPVGAVRFLEEAGIRGRMFNHQNYGGYLHWALDEPVYWDGRNLVFASLMRETTESTLAEVTERWQLAYLLLTEFEYGQLGEQLETDQWLPVYWDDFAAVFLQRDGPHRELVERRALVHLPPFGGMSELETLARNATWVEGARHELDQVLMFEPRCQRALYFQGLISFYTRELERAERELRQALTVNRSNHYVLEALARVLDGLGRAEEAREIRLEAVEAGPR